MIGTKYGVAFSTEVSDETVCSRVMEKPAELHVLGSSIQSMEYTLLLPKELEYSTKAGLVACISPYCH